MSNPNIPDHWKWKLRAFFSADVIGSTAFKFSHHNQWASAFTEFYKEFPVEIAGGYAEVPESIPNCDEKMELWKFSGDEILFHVELKNYKHLTRHVAAFKNAVREYSQQWSEKGPSFELKATGWLAGFPVTNREVKPKGGIPIEFIGPSIDLGFRLSKYSTSRKFVMSADMALMLLDAVDVCKIESTQFQVLMHGKEELKGILGGAPYPIFWLDTTNGETDLEEKLMGSTREFRADLTRKYLSDFLQQTPRTRRPFIEDDDGDRYGEVPDDLQDLRAEMMAEENQRDYSEEQHEDPAGDAQELPPPQSPPTPPAAN